MTTYTILFIMMTGNLLLLVASQNEEEKKGKKRTLIDTLWLLLTLMVWVMTAIAMMAWN